MFVHVSCVWLLHTAEPLSEVLQNTVLRLYSDHLSPDGKSVDYRGMSCSSAFRRYCELTVQFQRVRLGSLSREETLAFFINIYNTLVIHGTLLLGTPKNLWQRYRFFTYVSYIIGGEVFTLQDIENGVLRGNRRGMTQLLKPFSKDDPRLQAALPDAEPLVHFALNCGTKSCPPIKTYSAKDIDIQLCTAAQAFLETDNSCMVDVVKGEVRLSQIFRWYKEDFGGTDMKVLSWIVTHMNESPKKSSLQALLATTNYKVNYLPYDWSTNSMD
uniref:Zgc:152951 n=1 Tax=Scleropages formosus TaxID=113540 RepID=A0A8C9SEZ6_SCLFO